MEKLIRYLAVSVCLVTAPIAIAAPQAMEQYTVLAALTLNFARFTQWPEQTFAESGDSLNVCLVGDNVVQQSFESINGKNVGVRTIKIIYADRLRNLTQCHVLFISELAKNLLLQVFIDIKSHPVLTMGEDQEFLDSGGLVSMINKDGKIQLYVNLAAAKAARLNISSNLLRLAKIVGDN
ncbi:YfiR family protein [Methylomonas methanica]|jgi:hypothetical protein|nr:YfiR family protein [Methylomonas methanica]